MPPCRARVAVIGASTRSPRSSATRPCGPSALAGLHVVPVNPHEASDRRAARVSVGAGVPGAIDMATMYVPPDVGMQVIDEVARKDIPEVWLNPGSESDALVARARALGLNAIEACSIMGIGDSPVRATDGRRAVGYCDRRGFEQLVSASQRRWIVLDRPQSPSSITPPVRSTMASPPQPQARNPSARSGNAAPQRCRGGRAHARRSQHPDSGGQAARPRA